MLVLPYYPLKNVLEILQILVGTVSSLDEEDEPMAASTTKEPSF
jgi:hypothetical protein